MVRDILKEVSAEVGIEGAQTAMEVRQFVYPMPRTEGNVKLFELVKKAAGLMGQAEFPEQSSGGSGDAGWFSSHGIPSVDALGPYMYKIHHTEESGKVSSIEEKTALFCVVPGLIDSEWKQNEECSARSREKERILWLKTPTLRRRRARTAGCPHPAVHCLPDPGGLPADLHRPGRGLYEMDGNNRAISRTFQYVENTPINPWRAMLMVKAGVQSASFSAVVYKLNINEASKTFLSGAQSMGGIALIMVCARLRHVAGAQWGNK